MRKIRLQVCVLLAAVIGIVAIRFVCHAATGILFGNLITVNGTNGTTTVNSGVLGVGQVTLPLGRFIITNSGLTNYTATVSTNNLTVNIQESLDNTNWINVATYIPTVTNGANDTFTPVATPSVFLRASITSITNVNCAISFQQ